VSTAGAQPSPGRIELTADPRAKLGEGPLWDERRGQLWWLDLTGGALQFYDLDIGTDQSVNQRRMLGSLVADGRGGIIVAASGGLHQFCGNGQLRQLILLGGSLPCGVPNDSCCDPASGGVAQPATGGLFLYLVPVAGRPFRLRGQGPLQGPPFTPQP
jgi:sugar lactone lactonase YvrE